MKNIYNLKNISFQIPDKTFTIHEGTIGTYCYHDVLYCEVLYEDNHYKGKTSLFTHVLSRKSLYANFVFQGNVWCGLKIYMISGQILYVYLSTCCTQYNSLQFHDDTRMANACIDFFRKHRTCFKNIRFNTEDKTFIIENGDLGVYSYMDILKCKQSIEYEDAYALIHGNAHLDLSKEKQKAKVVLYFRMKDGRLISCNLSNQYLYVNDKRLLSDRLEAEEVKKLVVRIIKKYNKNAP